ncbi:MAG: hypothetical protein V4591_06495 [Bdellovibrionota bacterium]
MILYKESSIPINTETDQVAEINVEAYQDGKKDVLTEFLDQLKEKKRTKARATSEKTILKRSGNLCVYYKHKVKILVFPYLGKKVDDIFLNYLSEEEIKATDKEADEEMLVLKMLQEDVSKFAAHLMVEKNLGFRAFAKENSLSLSMASKIIKGAGNLTLETIAQIAQHNGKKAPIVFID